MKRVALLLPLVAGCIDFGAELNARLGMLGGGPDSGAPDSGTPDSGTADAGSVDAGCPGPNPCLLFASPKTGSSMQGVTALDDGTFLGAVLTVVREPNGSAISWSGSLYGAPDGGAYRAQTIPRIPYGDGDAGTTDSIGWPVAIAARGSSFALTDSYGYATIFDVKTHALIASTSTCGFPLDFQNYYDVAWFDDDTAYFAGSDYGSSAGTHLCKWNRTTGFTPIAIEATLDAGSSELRSVGAFGGELFMGDADGKLYTSHGATIDTPHPWTSSSTSNVWLSISGASPQQTWAAGTKFLSGQGALAKFDPASGNWVEQPAPLAMNVTDDLVLSQVLAVAPDNLWLVANFGNVFHSKGDDTWDAVPLPEISPTTFVRSVASHGAKDVAFGVEHDLPDGGAEGQLLIYTLP